MGDGIHMPEMWGDCSAFCGHLRGDVMRKGKVIYFNCLLTSLFLGFFAGIHEAVHSLGHASLLSTQFVYGMLFLFMALLSLLFAFIDGILLYEELSGEVIL